VTSSHMVPTEIARDAQIFVPVRLSRAAWEAIRSEHHTHVEDDPDSRLYEVLLIAGWHLDGTSARRIEFAAPLLPRNTRRAELVRFTARRGTGDDGEPMLIIELADEHEEAADA